MPEWLIGAVSKTVMGLVPIVGSNPTLSATKNAVNSRHFSFPTFVYSNGAVLRGSKSGSIRPIFNFSKSSGLRQEIHTPIKK